MSFSRNQSKTVKTVVSITNIDTYKSYELGSDVVWVIEFYLSNLASFPNIIQKHSVMLAYQSGRPCMYRSMIPKTSLVKVSALFLKQLEFFVEIFIISTIKDHFFLL